ncbi:23S rRNA (adenine1618-N6)-methyltransferase [Pedobacter sp. UYP24]
MSGEKVALHPRNKHRFNYDFAQLVKANPLFRDFIIVNAYGNESINFSNPVAVKILNQSLLSHFYDVHHWDIPEGYLCPPVPGRADYIHYLADLLAQDRNGVIPTGKSVKGLDIGTGANCIYPIIGRKEYAWSFIGSDTDSLAIKAAKTIVDVNPVLAGQVSLRLQENKHHVFKGVIKSGERFDFTMCNPPFHASAEEAAAASEKKGKNLGYAKGKVGVLNFGGKSNELWYEGGELEFIRKMIEESLLFGSQCLWFTSLVSKSANLPFIYGALKYAKAKQVETVQMAQGQKISRFVAWTFQDIDERRNWLK